MIVAESEIMHDYYKILGINSNASVDDIRKAYRILARRYHPDLNPDEATDKFKLIAEAYRTLKDSVTRKQYDIEYQAYLKANRNRAEATAAKAQASATAAAAKTQAATKKQAAAPSEEEITPDFFSSAADLVKQLLGTIKNSASTLTTNFRAWIAPTTTSTTFSTDGHTGLDRISIIEISINIHDAINGVRKTVEIAEPEGSRKISVRIPAGVRSGSVVRLRANKGNRGEELVLIVKVANHPFLSIQPKGLVMEVPISIKEALLGASISVPTVSESAIIKILPGTQSGTEIRLKEKGIVEKDGKKNDLFIRLIVEIPTTTNAVGVADAVEALEEYYEEMPRRNFPTSLSKL